MQEKKQLSPGTKWLVSRTVGFKTEHGTTVTYGPYPGEVTMSSRLKLWTKAKISDILTMIETAEPGGELAKMRSEITALKSRVESLREGLEDIRSLRRIGHVSDVAVECDFYLNRDDEEI